MKLQTEKNKWLEISGSFWKITTIQEAQKFKTAESSKPVIQNPIKMEIEQYRGYLCDLLCLYWAFNVM